MQDRLPPHSPEAERGVLGCLLLDQTNKSANEAVLKLGPDGEAFYDLQHRSIYEAAVSLIDKGSHVDYVTLSESLKAKQTLEQCGGLTYLMTLGSELASTENIGQYLSILQEKAQLRKLLQTCHNLIGSVHDAEEPASALITNAEKKILEVRGRARTGWSDNRNVLQQLTCNYEAMQRGEMLGITTGLTDLDKVLSGLHPQNVVVVGARPSVGKTSFAMNLVEHVVFDLGIPSAVFSLEMSTEEIMHRMVCTMARVDNTAVRERRATEGDITHMTLAMSKLVQAPLYICDKGGLTLGTIVAMARGVVQSHGVKFMVIDYLQLLESGKKGVSGLREEITRVSNGLKQLAKELNVVIVVVSQLNRESESEKRAPAMRDLRESGAIEQDADVIMLLHQEEPGQVIVGVEKNRNGRVAKVPVTWIPQYTKFLNFAKVSEEDIPADSRQAYPD